MTGCQQSHVSVCLTSGHLSITSADSITSAGYSSQSNTCSITRACSVTVHCPVPNCTVNLRHVYT